MFVRLILDIMGIGKIIRSLIEIWFYKMGVNSRLMSFYSGHGVMLQFHICGSPPPWVLELNTWLFTSTSALHRKDIIHDICSDSLNYYYCYVRIMKPKKINVKYLDDWVLQREKGESVCGQLWVRMQGNPV